jgi:hypothetical protein
MIGVLLTILFFLIVMMTICFIAGVMDKSQSWVV